MTRPIIGVFDSGVGGLTVLRELRRCLPGADYLYLGDTARVPYGTKSPAVVRRYALEAAWFLNRWPLAALVVACNTASAHALDPLRRAYPDLPIVGVVEPGAAAVAERVRTGLVGVLATEGTVASGAYRRAIAVHGPGLVVEEVACPLFVPLAEEGWVRGDVPRLAAEHYLGRLRERGVVAVVLGCTHYPLLRATIAEVLGAEVAIVDSARPVAEAVVACVARAGTAERGTVRFFTTDTPDRFVRVGARFLGEPITYAEHVDLEALVAAEIHARGDDHFLHAGAGLGG